VLNVANQDPTRRRAEERSTTEMMDQFTEDPYGRVNRHSRRPGDRRQGDVRTTTTATSDRAVELRQQRFAMKNANLRGRTVRPY